MVKRVFGLNFLDSFIFGITTVAVPLLMLERNIELGQVGLALSLSPLAKGIVRLLCASLADSKGERPFFVLNGVANFLLAPIYFFSSSPVGFAIGKAVDGARESFIWAVNRTSIMAHKPEKEHYILGGMISGRAIYFALGSLSLWLLFPAGGFEGIFALVAALGIIMTLLSLRVRNSVRVHKPPSFGFRFFGREKRFYQTVGVLAIGGTFYTFIIYFLCPIFFRILGFSLGEIGLFYAIYFLIFGAVLNAVSHFKVPPKATALAGSLFFLAGLGGLSFAGQQLLPYFFFTMAIGDGFLGLLWEQIIYLQAKGSKNLSTEIAIIHLPLNVFLFVLSGVSGFVIQLFGFAPLLLLGAASLVAFSFFGLRLVEGN
ncbi:MAG: MFS transporter [Candidatus Micrarchaeota archaeon]|nr:MFS transporter [Candidatus Micrarchaeota archaeon]